MLKTVRNVLAVVGIAVIATAGSVAPSFAGVTTPTDVAKIQPAPGQMVGVAMPVTVTFAQAIANRTAAERTVTIRDGRIGGAGYAGQDYLVVDRNGSLQLPADLLMDWFWVSLLPPRQQNPRQHCRSRVAIRLALPRARSR